MRDVSPFRRLGRQRSIHPAFSKSEGPTRAQDARSAVFINTLGVSVSAPLRFPSERGVLRETRTGRKRWTRSSREGAKVQSEVPRASYFYARAQRERERERRES